MSAKAHQDGLAIGRLWRRWRFHLSVVMLLVPIAYLKPYFDQQTALLEATEKDLRSTPLAVGPRSMQLQELGNETPFWNPKERAFQKPFRIVPCTACVPQIRAIFIRVRKPGSSNDYGADFEGNPYRPFADMLIPKRADESDKIWITVEGWNGSRHQASLPITEASPVTARWLKAFQRPKPD